MIYDKKKDLTPQNTVENIKSILQDIGIPPLEEMCMERIINDHVTESIFLKLPNDMTVTANGKGTNYEYALASAYGEFMERLEVGNLFPITPPDQIKITPKELISKGYLNFWFNEDLKKVEKYVNIAVDVCCNYTNYINKEEKTAELLPFYHVNKDEISYISPNLLQYTGGFTGSCAGNTPYEALVEGLSEVFERHIIRKAIKEPISFTDIPEEFYLKYESIKRIIEYCRKLGFKVVVKDASLGKKYPVACAVLLDEKTNGYYVWFGAHPSLPIAIERCFTEIFQGADFSNKNYVNALFKFSGRRDNIIPDARMDNAFNHRFLEVNAVFFSKKPDYLFSYDDWKENESISNKDLFKNMIKILTDKKIDVFIRDISFLNFPAYIICVPKLISTLNNIDISSGIDIRNNYYKTVRVIGENIPINLTPQEVLDFFEYAFHLQMLMKNDYKNFELVYIITLLKTKQYQKILNIITPLKNSFKYSKYKKMFLFLMDYINAKFQNIYNIEYENNLYKKYGKHFVKKLIEIFDTDDSFQNAINMLKKHKFYYLKHITEENINRKKYISEKILKKYKENTPNQKLVKNLFN